MLKKSMQELNRLSTKEYKEKHNAGYVVVLDNVRSAFNVGSIFRSADCFGIAKIYLCGITCKTDNRELQKSALGAEMSVDSEYMESTSSLIDLLVNQGFELIAVEQTKESILLDNFSFENGKKYAFVLGNEVEGVSEEVVARCHKALEIPQIGAKHSLNIANAASIVLWEAFRQS